MESHQISVDQNGFGLAGRTVFARTALRTISVMRPMFGVETSNGLLALVSGPPTLIGLWAAMSKCAGSGQLTGRSSEPRRQSRDRQYQTGGTRSLGLGSP